ncbi:MAG: DUF2079 domain-containing protein [Acidimicrobiia bacterium]|nr:DUF2079 domain-containing protein [Acidimicrobiia bacterium]
MAERAPRSAAWRQIRRKFDNIGLRWHARLDSDWADRSLPWILSGTLFVLLGALSLARLRMGEAGVGLATSVQQLWLIDAGREPVSTITGVSPMGSTGAWLFYPLAWALGFVPRAAALVVIQSAALAYAVLPLWRIARRLALLRVGAATALVVAYGLFPTVHNLSLDDFQPVALAIPALFALQHHGLAGHHVRLGLSALWAVGWRADLALTIAAFGVLLAVTRQRRAGIVVAVTAGLYTVAAALAPWLGAGDGLSPATGAYTRFGSGAGGVAVGLLTRPGTVLSSLGAEQNFVWVTALLLPLALLPLLSFRYLTPALPWFLLAAVGERDARLDLTLLSAPLVPFLLVATAFALVKVGRRQHDRVAVHPRLSAALMVATLIGFIGTADASPYNKPWGWGGRDLEDQARSEAQDRVEGSEAVVVSPSLAAALAERAELWLFVPGEPVPLGTEVVVIDRADLVDAGVDEDIVDDVARPEGFGIEFDLRGVAVFRPLEVLASGDRSPERDDGNGSDGSAGR